MTPADQLAANGLRAGYHLGTGPHLKRNLRSVFTQGNYSELLRRSSYHALLGSSEQLQCGLICEEHSCVCVQQNHTDAHTFYKRSKQVFACLKRLLCTFQFRDIADSEDC